MSVRGYIVRERHIWVDEERNLIQHDNNGENLTKYTHEDLEYAINIWHQDKLIEEMLSFGAEDYTNHDFIGEIEMGKEDWEKMLEYSKRVWDTEDWDSIKLINKYFEEDDWLILKCY